MSVDTVNYALTDVRVAIETTLKDFYFPGAREHMLLMCNCARDCLMAENITGFTNYVQSRLASHPDAMGEILDQLFERLNITVWEELEAILSSRE